MSSDIFSEYLSIHDKYRFEIKINFKHDFSDEHIFEYYFFIPSSLNISYFTYSKEHFYSSIQRYIRYSAPSISILDLFNINNEFSPYSRAINILDELKIRKTDYLIETFIDEIKLSAVIIKDRIVEVISLQDINRIISELELIKSLFFESFLFMFKKICSFSVPSEIKQTFRSVDEYVTLLMLEVINKVFEENKDKIDPFKVRLYKLADDIYNYRKTQGYIYPNEENQKEYFLYYRGLLKKFISSCLFLNCEPAFNLHLHIASSIGSAVAMLFAIIVMIYAQIKYSITSAVFIVIAVISYVFKDRIKEFVKILFIKKTGGFIYDRKIKIKEPTHNFSIGYIKESFFISNINSIDEDIIKERKRNYLFIYEDVLNETVLKYKKVVKLEPKKIISYHKRRRNLVDIMRFSIYDFIKHADDEVINYPTYYGNNFKEEKLFKNYVINIIVRYFYDKKDKIYERYKIVFNRSGIINVDKY